MFTEAKCWAIPTCDKSVGKNSYNQLQNNNEALSSIATQGSSIIKGTDIPSRVSSWIAVSA